MRKYFIWVLLFFTQAVYGQSYKFETIGVIKDKKSLSDFIMFENKFYGLETFAKSKFGWTLTLEKVKQGCKLMSFNNDLGIEKEISLAEGKEVYGPFPPFLKEINNKLYLVYYMYDSKAGIEVYASKVDVASLVLSEPKKILTIEQKNGGLFKILDLYNSYDLLIKTSADKSKNFFFWTSGVNNAFSYSVTDGDMNIIKNGTQELENVKEFTISNMLIDNAGNFFVGILYERKDVFYPYLLAGSRSNVKTVEVKLEGYSAHDVYVSEGNNEGQVKVYGTSSKDGTYITGAFSVNMDKKNLAFSKLITKDIPAELVEKFDHDGFAKTKKKDYGLYPQVQFDNLVMADGSIILAGDLTRYQNMGQNRSLSPVKGSSLIIVYNTNGEILFNRLPKREFLGQKKGSNFFAHQWGSKLVLFYTDLETNVNTPIGNAETASFTSRKENVLVAATVENDGKIFRRILHPNTTNSFYFSPGSTSRVDDNTLLLGLGKDKIGLTTIKTTYAFYLLKISDE